MIPALLLSAALSTPAAADDCVRVLPVGLRDVQLAGGEARFDLVLSVQRTCGMAVRLKRLDYRVSVNGVQLADREVEYEGIKLKRDTSAEVVVPVGLDAGEAARLAWSALTSARLSVALSGEATVTWLIFPLTLPFDEQIASLGT